jgi:hypothetical protein
MGRPSIYNEALADLICYELENGKSLREISRDKSFPERSTVLRWQRDKPDFAAKIARAHIDQADSHAERILEIVGKVEAGDMDPNAGKVAMWGLTWTAAKQAPKKYGEKIELEHSGQVGIEQRLIQGRQRLIAAREGDEDETP